jgi:hypothetical protein
MGWGLGYLLLALLAAFLCLRGLSRWRSDLFPRWSRVVLVGRQGQQPPMPGEGGGQGDEVKRQEVVGQCAQLAILASVGLTLFLYALAPVAAVSPETTFRYLTCALLALPVLLWPLWKGSARALGLQRKLHQARAGQQEISRPSASAHDQGARMATALPSTLLLLLVAVTFVTGTVRTFAAVPAAQADYQRRLTLIRELEAIGATRVYSEYWTCNWLVFLSQERIICSVLDAELRPGFNRYGPYRLIVDRAPAPAYVFPVADNLLDAVTGRQQARFFQQHVLSSPEARATYRLYQFLGYLVYQARPSAASPSPPPTARAAGP